MKPTRRLSSLRLWFLRAMPVLFAATWLNGVLFFAEILPQNLLPDVAYRTADQAFIWSKNIGGYVEVTPSYYDWIRFHGVTFFASGGLLLVGCTYFLLDKFSVRLASEIRRVERRSRIFEIEHEGVDLASPVVLGDDSHRLLPALQAITAKDYGQTRRRRS